MIQRALGYGTIPLSPDAAHLVENGLKSCGDFAGIDIAGPRVPVVRGHDHLVLDHCNDDLSAEFELSLSHIVSPCFGEVAMFESRASKAAEQIDDDPSFQIKALRGAWGQS